MLSLMAGNYVLLTFCLSGYNKKKYVVLWYRINSQACRRSCVACWRFQPSNYLDKRNDAFLRYVWRLTTVQSPLPFCCFPPGLQLTSIFTWEISTPKVGCWYIWFSWVQSTVTALQLRRRTTASLLRFPLGTLMFCAAAGNHKRV